METLRELWANDRPRYEALCTHVRNTLRPAIWNRGISCEIQTRTKEPDSLLKKALRKDYDEPYEGIRDKAGARLVCTYRSALTELEDIVREHFEVCGYENKTTNLGYDRLGYPGIHIEITALQNAVEASPEIAGLVCEIQLLTRAQSLWADISHQLAYKPAQDPPDEIKRAINVQGALIELFDNEMERTRHEVLNLKGFQEAKMLEALDRHFFRFAAERYDKELSLYVLDRLIPLFSPDEIQRFEPLLCSFVSKRQDTLSTVFKDYADDDRRSPLLFQPESIVIFMCLERDRFNLKRIWGEFLPLEVLQGLADVWGMDIGTTP